MRKMTDLEIAKAHLPGHSLCLCKDGTELLTHDGKGISPMLDLLTEGADLRGWSAADLIVGKAAAMLFEKAGVCAVYGEVMSESAAAYLQSRGIPCSCGKMTPQIINRAGTGQCPMEETVAALDDCETGFRALLAKRDALRSAAK